MRYELAYTRRAVRDIKRLDEQSKRRLGVALERYADSPFQFAKKLTSPELGTYRFRVGDFRVVFDIEGNKLIILRVGHRREIYRG